MRLLALAIGILLLILSFPVPVVIGSVILDKICDARGMAYDMLPCWAVGIAIYAILLEAYYLGRYVLAVF